MDAKTNGALAEARYLYDWADSQFFGVVADFAGIYITRDEYESDTSPYANESCWQERKAEMASALADPKFAGVEILLATYQYENYSGEAFVLFRRSGKLYEVNGGHCSCHGLEGQWEPEETTVESLSHRMTHGNLGGGEWGMQFKGELEQVLAAITQESAP